jgi:hypothetical protein
MGQVQTSHEVDGHATAGDHLPLAGSPRARDVGTVETRTDVHRASGRSAPRTAVLEAGGPL